MTLVSDSLAGGAGGPRINSGMGDMPPQLNTLEEVNESAAMLNTQSNAGGGDNIHMLNGGMGSGEEILLDTNSRSAAGSQMGIAAAA